MKTMTLGFFALTTAGSLLANPVEPVQTVIMRSVVGNTSAGVPTINAPSLAYGQAGINSLNSFSASLQIEFQAGGLPVNVTNFSVVSMKYNLVCSGNPVWIDGTYLDYNPVSGGDDKSKPDLLTYNTSGIKTSVDLTPLVGTNIPVASKFQLLDQFVTFNGVNLPKLSFAGQYYRLSWHGVVRYTFGGQLYDHEITADQTAVTVSVFDDIPGFTSGGLPGPFQIVPRLQFSQDLSHWTTIPETQVIIPYPLPSWVDSEKDLATLYPAPPATPNFFWRVATTEK